MANVLDLKRRIRSVKNTRQITKAMKMVSAAKLRRAQERALAARPYAESITAVLASLTRRIEIFDPATGNLRHPLFAVRPEKNILLVVVTGDKGFAGAFNANIMKAALNVIDESTSDGADKQIDIEAIGRKGRDLMKRRFPTAKFDSVDIDSLERPVRNRASAVEITGDHPGLLDKPVSSRVFKLASDIIARYIHGEIDACYIVYNEFKSVISQRVVVERLLPLMDIGRPEVRSLLEPTSAEKERAAEAALTAGVALTEADATEAVEESHKFGTANVDYIYEQPAEELFDGLLPQYVSSMLYHSIVESVAAEHAARMTAMDSATNNASDMIDAYTLQMNRVRQAAITKEIIEIVSGAAAV